MTEPNDSAKPLPENASPLSQWLWRERTKRKLTREQASAFVGLGISSFASYERGARTPTEQMLQKLAAAFGEPPDEVTAWYEERLKSPVLPKKFFLPPENATPLQNWLFTEREKRQKTKEEMGRACGLAYNMYGSYEAGKCLPGNDAMDKISACLGLVPPLVRDWLAEQRKAISHSRVRKREHLAKTPLSEWVIAERLKRRMTQQELAEDMGFRPMGLKELEMALKLPKRQRLQKIIDYFGGIPPEVLEWYEAAVAESRFRGFQNETEELSPFGRIIRELRRKANMSMGELADRLGKDKKSYVARLENGSRRIPEAVVKDLAHIFGFPQVPPSWRQALLESEQNWHHRAEREDEEVKPLGLEIRRLRKLHFKSAEQMAASLNWPL